MNKTVAGVIAFSLALLLVGGAGVGLYLAGQQSGPPAASKGTGKEVAPAVAGEEPPARLTDWVGKVVTLKGCTIKQNAGSYIMADWKGVRLRCDGPEKEFEGLRGKAVFTITGRCEGDEAEFTLLSECKVSDIIRP